MKFNDSLKSIVRLGLTAVSFVASVNVACATPLSLNIDQLLFQADIANPSLGSQLSATVEVEATATNSLKLFVTNTSSASISSGAFVLLTGVGFNLPGLTILGGSAALNIGSSAVGGWSGDLSKEWGYANGAASSGHFDYLGDGPATLPTNARVSSMNVDSTNAFAAGSIDGPSHLGGPDFGAVSLDGNAGGQNAVGNSVVLTLNLSGSWIGATGYTNSLADFQKWIDDHDVVVTFSSPGSVRTNVPDGGSTLALLGSVVIAFQLLFRRNAA